MSIKRTLTLAEMAKLQGELNSKALPGKPDWFNHLTVSDFELAAVMEIAELTDSLPWKWWKKGKEIDTWNVKIETIDAIHFLVSKLILIGFPYTTKLSYYEYERGTMTFFNATTSGNRQLIADITKSIVSNVGHNKAIDAIDKLLLLSEIKEEELAAIYMAKLTLNVIRYENGYADGTYKKIHDGGIEDNVLLQEVVNSYLLLPEVAITELPDLVRAKINVFANNLD